MSNTSNELSAQGDNGAQATLTERSQSTYREYPASSLRDDDALATLIKRAESTEGDATRGADWWPVSEEFAREIALVTLTFPGPGMIWETVEEIREVCERTIARHLKWARWLVADTMLEASELTPFAELPIVRVGGGGRAELRHYLTALCAAGRASGGGGAALGIIRCLHLRYVVVRARNPVAIPLNLVFTVAALVRYQLSIPPMEASTWMYYWGPPTIWPNWKSTCC